MVDKLDKLKKTLGDETVAELTAASADTLKQRIVAAEDAMHTVQRELEQNEKYQQIKADKKNMEQGKRDVNKRQRAIITFALLELESRGK